MCGERNTANFDPLLKECELKNTLVPHTFSIEIFLAIETRPGQMNSQWLKTKGFGVYNYPHR